MFVVAHVGLSLRRLQSLMSQTGDQVLSLNSSQPLLLRLGRFSELNRSFLNLLICLDSNQACLKVLAAFLDFCLVGEVAIVRRFQIVNFKRTGIWVACSMTILVTNLGSKVYWRHQSLEAWVRWLRNTNCLSVFGCHWRHFEEVGLANDSSNTTNCIPYNRLLSLRKDLALILPIYAFFFNI